MDIMEALIRNFEEINSGNDIGCLEPQYIDTNSNRIIAPQKIELLSEYCCTVSSMITSGLLTKYSVLKKIGKFNLRINHPVREYYQLRDSIKIFWKNYVPVKYKIRFLLMWFPMPLFYFFFLPNRFLRLKYIFYGFLDGLKGKCGSFEKLHGSG